MDKFSSNSAMSPAVKHLLYYYGSRDFLLNYSAMVEACPTEELKLREIILGTINANLSDLRQKMLPNMQIIQAHFLAGELSMEDMVARVYVCLMAESM